MVNEMLQSMILSYPGASGRTRTDTWSPIPDFESVFYRNYNYL